MPRKTTKRRKSDSSVPLEVPRETTVSEPMQPEETQGIPDKSREESINLGHDASVDVEEHDPTPATPVESVHTTPSSEPRRRQEDEESDPFDVDFDEGSDPYMYQNDGNGRSRRMKRRRTRTLSSIPPHRRVHVNDVSHIHDLMHA
jgi:hypothetical protein